MALDFQLTKIFPGQYRHLFPTHLTIPCDEPILGALPMVAFGTILSP